MFIISGICMWIMIMVFWIKKSIVYFVINHNLGEFILHQKERKHFSLRLSKNNYSSQTTLCKVWVDPLKFCHTSETLHTQEVSLYTPWENQSPRKESHTHKAQPPDPRSSDHFLGAGKKCCTLGKLDSLSQFPGGRHVFSF